MIIVAPRDAARLVQLCKKLDDYEGRMDPYLAPELQMDTICKKEVLGRLLAAGIIDTEYLQTNLEACYGPEVRHHFANAVAVIEDYVLTGGAQTFGGTGLPKA